MALIEGIAIAAFAIGAAKAFVYSRSEYPHANATFAKALAAVRATGGLGPRAFGPNNPFDIELRIGAGAYVCGEETALLESLEGKRGQVRAKPPLPVHAGLFGKPTVINNVLTLATAPWIMAHGAKAYADIGYGRSRGTMPIQLAGNVKFPGLYEAPFGLTLGQIVNEIGGGTATGRPVRAVQCGGPARRLLSRRRCSTRPTITRPSPPGMASSAMAALWFSTIASIWPRKRVSPWNSAPSKAAASARPAASARCAARK